MDKQEYLSSLKNTELRPGKVKVQELVARAIHEKSSRKKGWNTIRR